MSHGLVRFATRAFGSLLLTGVVSAAELPAAPNPPPPDAGGWRYEELRRFPAAEAKQGVASDGEFLYVIADRAIGKYRAATGERVAMWQDVEGGPIIHLNSGIVRDGKLFCAHSNYPGVPMVSSVEIFDTATLKQVGSHSFGRTDGSLTWVDRRASSTRAAAEERWVACFVHYGKKGGEPGRGPEWTHLVEFDDAWRQSGGWVFPSALIARLGAKGYSASGGAFGPAGFLFVTGHDDPELHVLALPGGGASVKWIATIPITATGQAFGWDPRQAGVIYFIQRPGEVIVGRVTPP